MHYKLALILHIKLRMGQCTLSEMEMNGCRDIFSSQQSEEGSSFSKESCTQKDRLLWDYELNMSANNNLAEKAFWAENSNLTHPCFNQISKDVTRTFPELPFFGNKSNIQRFQKVLQKIALYFPHVGYTQGLNFTVGFLLISGCQQQECFRLMAKMMQHDRILAIGLYEDNFPLVQFYCQVFWQLLQKKMPNVYAILNKRYITNDLWLFQWFISLFLYNFPLQFTKRIWDFIICKKQMATVLIALGIIKSLKKQLIEIQFQDQIEFLDFVNQFKSIEFCRQFLDLRKIISFANSITKSQIDRAISQTKCVDNPYRIYFSSPPSSQKEQWQALMKKYQNSRISFAHNTEPIKYERTDVFQNLQKLILTKYKLYQSQLKKSNSQYRKSNLSTPISFRTCKSNSHNGLNWDNNQKNRHL